MDHMDSEDFTIIAQKDITLESGEILNLDEESLVISNVYPTATPRLIVLDILTPETITIH